MVVNIHVGNVYVRNCIGVFGNTALHTYTTEMYTIGLCTLCFERERMLNQKTEHLLQLYDPPFLRAEVIHHRGGRDSFHFVSLSQRERVCALPKQLFLSSCLLLDYSIYLLPQWALPNSKTWKSTTIGKKLITI